MAVGSRDLAVIVSVVHLVRHGQAAFGTADYDRLTPLGEQQCRQLARHWFDLGRPAPQIYSGTLRRHRESAAAFCEGRRAAGGSVGPVFHAADLEEYDHEALLDRLAETHPGAPSFADCWHDRKLLQQALEQALAVWTGPGVAGYPSFAEFRDRCAASLAGIMREVGRGREAVVFASAGSLAAAMQPILGIGDAALMRLTLGFYNTGVSTLLFNSDAASVESINGLAHLQQPGLLQLITKR